MAKYIAFSLWGNQSIYSIGIIKNADLAKIIYPDWKMVVFFDNTVPKDILVSLTQREVHLVDMTNSPIFQLFWRFLAADFQDCEYAVFRDADSRLTKREYLAVEEWIRNEDEIHIMRDHPAHEIPFGSTSRTILGGMWGIKGNMLDMEKSILDFCKNKENVYGIDQAYLENIYNLFNHSKTVHDEFFEKKPFPIKRQSYRFIGERMDEKDNPLGEDWMMIKCHYQEKSTLSKLKRSIKKLFKK